MVSLESSSMTITQLRGLKVHKIKLQS